MKPIKITVTGSNARVTEKPVITSGTVGLPVEFTFDKAWEGLSKTAVFRAGSRSFPVRCVQSTAIVPWEVLEKPGIGLYIGVFGTDTTGAVRIPTVWVLVDTVRQGTTVPDATPTEATPSVYDQILFAANEAVEVANSVREDAVLYIKQELTHEQKAQARANIGAEDWLNKTVETTTVETAIEPAWVDGYVNTDGTPDSRTGYFRTDYLPIGEYDKVAVRFTAFTPGLGSGDVYIARYDKDKNYIANSRGTLGMYPLNEDGTVQTDYEKARPNINYINTHSDYQYGIGIDINPADYADGTEYIVLFNFRTGDEVTMSITGFTEPQEVVTYTIPEEMLPECTEAQEAKELAQGAVALAEEAKGVAEEAKELAQTAKPTGEIPLSDYVEPLVDEIALAAKAHMKEDSLCIVLFTDTHYVGTDTCFPSLIAKKLAQATNASAILHLGDLVHLYTEDKSVGLEIFQKHSKILQDTKIPYLQVVGNHDDGQMYLHNYTHDYSAENYIKAYEMYHATTKQSRRDIVLGSKNGWYYMDDEDSKTRLIVLNSHDYPWVENEDGTLAYDSNAVSSIACIYSAEQLEWLANTALNFADKGDVTEQAKWSVLAFAHMGTSNWSAINSLFTAFWAGNKKESFSSSQTDTFGLYDYSGITITNDFSLVGGRKIAFLMGDIHKDKVSGGNYPLITFLDCKYETVKLGTPNEAALSVLIATPSEGTITELRFGEGTKTVDGAQVAHNPLTDYDNYRVINY